MDVIWWFDSIGLWFHQHWIIGRWKRRGKESLDKKKGRWKESDVVSLVFLVQRMHSCVKHEKQESVWIGREWWWKSGRQGEKSGRKRGGKKGKGKKWFWEMSFLFLFDCVFASSLFSHSTHHTTRHNTRLHSSTTHHTTWRIGAHHHMQTGPCAVLPFWEWTARHIASSTPLTPSHDITQHTNELNTDTAHGASNIELTIANENRIG